MLQLKMLCCVLIAGSRLTDPTRFKFDGSSYYIKSAKEMYDLFKEFPEACRNTVEIAQRCNVFLMIIKMAFYA